MAEVHTGVSESNTCTDIPSAFFPLGKKCAVSGAEQERTGKSRSEPVMSAGTGAESATGVYLSRVCSQQDREEESRPFPHGREEGNETYSIWDLASRSPWSAAIRGKYLTVWRRAHSEKTSETVVFTNEASGQSLSSGVWRGGGRGNKGPQNSLGFEP